MIVIALLQGPSTLVPSTPTDMVIHSDVSTKVVLAILVVLSLLSWGVMLAKWRQFKRAERGADEFMRGFEQSRSLEQVTALAQRTPENPHTQVFARAIQFLTETTPALAPTAERAARLSGSQVEALRLVLDAQTNTERELLGHFVPWLATIGSVSPLIGLFGTVLGVISSFIGIATQGSGNISAVAPGVAQALIATAAALAVAIPAVFGYNAFANRLNRLDNELESFGSELIALMVREGRI